MKIQFIVLGKPQPKGSTRSFGFRRKDGSIGAKTTSANPELRPWASAFSWEAKAAMGDLAKAPRSSDIAVTLRFSLARPKGHFNKKGELLPSAPQRPLTKPDLDKLTRAALDAMTGIVWSDDSQVTDIDARKDYCDSPFVVPSTTVQVMW